MPKLKEKKIKFIFDEWGCRHNQMGAPSGPMGGFPQSPGMLTPLSYALLLNEIFRHSDMVQASCPTGGLFEAALVDDTGEATGFSIEGLVLRIWWTTSPAPSLFRSAGIRRSRRCLARRGWISLRSPLEAPPILWTCPRRSPEIARSSFSRWSTRRKRITSSRRGWGQAARGGQAVADCGTQSDCDE